ncbi:hypothetical protein [Roseiconus lacunae]|uniref:Chemotaxis protein CheX n=1 Tax=Roseiconus lacunae TaxID=2605694 RepID=A0ABT7PCU7_9BACT|nr:hypothetical protein [Roseiconus lacunae]MCD0463479.1 hypothetical protein [Roseiconus lacunae]MDM4014071.1 hypothetical protein [Roseiconus lacunae]WRQ53363.1 hypothetical protein U8335_12750 [Stieleria sp. HD01]
MTTASSNVTAEDVGSFLSNLLGLKIQSNDCDNDVEPAAVAVYVDDEGNPAGYIVTDVACSATLGAALTQIPPGIVKESIQTKQIAENLRENIGEVFNIAVNLLPSHESSHLVLQKADYEGGIELPAPDKISLDHSFELDVQRYGKGKIRLIQC